MINYLNRHHAAARFVTWVIACIGRLTGVDKQIAERGKEIQKTHQVEYALGYITWFILYGLRLKLPHYNIYHLVGDEDSRFVSKLLSDRLDEYPVAKQYYLLRSESEVDDDFKSSVISFLESAIRSPRRNTAFKVRDFDLTKAFEALCDINTILRSAGLHPFLVSGTLLGVIRDNQLIDGDNDLDIGVMATEASAKSVFSMLLDSREFRSVHNLGQLVQINHRNNTVIDIFIHQTEGDKIWHGTDIHKWENSSFELEEIEFQSEIFLIPDNPRRYLDENYGNWHNPVLFWDYSFDTPNRRFWSDKKTAYYLVERITSELTSKKPSRFIVQSALQELRDLFNIDLTHHIASNISTDGHANQKEKVVITFGTFDLFHIGHLNILKRAASYGDKLIVGVSSDELNYSKKDSYPVYCQEDRLRIVEAIDCVDFAFYEEDLELKREYLELYKADTLIMGDDWNGKFDEMSEICEVVYLPRTESISTTETKDSIKRNL